MPEDGYLVVDEINTFYGESHILHDLSLEVSEGEIVSILGRNGAGKTTTLRSIMGLTPSRSGTIHFRGEDITDDAPHERLRRGIAHVPEDRVVFPNLTVEENLKVPQKATDTTEAFTLEEIYDLFPVLEEYRDRQGFGLSGGEQQMLTIGRSLLSNPDLLLLDEPSEGLAPQIVSDVHDAIEQLSERNITILLVEQNMALAEMLSDHHYIIERGEVRYEGSLDDLDPELREQLLSVG